MAAGESKRKWQLPFRKLNLHPLFRKRGEMYFKNERLLRNVSHAFLFQAQKTAHVLVLTALLLNHHLLSLNRLFSNNISMGGMGLHNVLSYKLYKYYFNKGMSNKGILWKKYIVVTFYKICNLSYTIWSFAGPVKILRSATSYSWKWHDVFRNVQKTLVPLWLSWIFNKVRRPAFTAVEAFQSLNVKW